MVFLPLFAYAQVSKIVFITEPQTIKPNELSGPITIQTQDSAGISTAIGETSDVFVNSSSVVGEFSSSATNWQSTAKMTMNSNWANRTFYYKDSVEGTYTITVKVVGRTSLKEWSANQIITISNSLSSTSTAATTTEQTTTNTAASGSSGRNSLNTVTFSTYYISAPLTTVNKEIEFAVGAGRDRLGSVGSPLEFKAETNVKYTRNNFFKWNFGDGHEGIGKVLSHTYEYPGEYVVMLNTTAPEGQAVARVNVKIIEPEIAVTLATPERIELKNNSKYEVSLFGRALVSNGKVFIFPQDTIIKAGQSISFSANTTNLRPNGLHDAGILIIGESVIQPNLVAKIEEQKLNKIATIRDKIANLQQQRLALLQREGVSNLEVKAEAESGSSTPQTALTLDSVSQIKSSKINGWLETLKHFFLRTQ